jgi:aubergine-like protein
MLYKITFCAVVVQFLFCFKGALHKYHFLNKVLPDKIIIYRDGVGDGQLKCVAENELPQLLDAFKTFACEKEIDWR